LAKFAETKKPKFTDLQTVCQVFILVLAFNEHLESEKRVQKSAPRPSARALSLALSFRGSVTRDLGARVHRVQRDFLHETDGMTTGTDVVANEQSSGKDILDENLWPGFDKFKVVQVRDASFPVPRGTKGNASPRRSRDQRVTLPIQRSSRTSSLPLPTATKPKSALRVRGVVRATQTRKREALTLTIRASFPSIQPNIRRAPRAAR
jgi:hypothetical protein